MSYCRPGEYGSDIYMYTTGKEWVIETPNDMFELYTLQDAKDKLLELRDAGLQIPDRVFVRIENEFEDPEWYRKNMTAYLQSIVKEVKDESEKTSA